MADWGLYDAPSDDFDVDDPDLDFDVEFTHDRHALFPDLKAVAVSVMAAAGVSPSSSPRLPSPPPFTEVQIGPKSPTVGEPFGNAGEKLLGATQETDDGSMRRIRPGTKAADMASGPPLIPLSQVCFGHDIQTGEINTNHRCITSARFTISVTRASEGPLSQLHEAR